MEYIKENKTTIIGCLLLIVGTLIIYFTFNNPNEYGFENNGETYLRNYEVNEVIPVYITDEQVAKKYLTEYVNMLIYHPKEAFLLLDEDSLLNRFDSYISFKKYIDSLINKNFAQAKVMKYVYNIENGKKCLHIIDANSNEFVFIENSLMDYRVSIN